MAGKFQEHKVRCSFCNKSEDQVRKLIAGPEGVYICDGCIEICQEILELQNQIAACKEEIAAKKGERLCPSCGAHIPRNARFCMQCGCHIEQEEPETDSETYEYSEYEEDLEDIEDLEEAEEEESVDAPEDSDIPEEVKGDEQ